MDDATGRKKSWKTKLHMAANKSLRHDELESRPSEMVAQAGDRSAFGSLVEQKHHGFHSKLVLIWITRVRRSEQVAQAGWRSSVYPVRLRRGKLVLGAVAGFVARAQYVLNTYCHGIGYSLKNS